MTEPEDRATQYARIMALAERIRDLGKEMSLPYVGASADISSTEPMHDGEGRPFVETVFHWLDPKLEYWKDRTFALRAVFITAARYTAEPFIYWRGGFGSWRPNPRLEAIPAESVAEYGIAAALVCPVHLPGGTIAAVVWAASEPHPNLDTVFADRAAELHMTATRFMAAYHDAQHSNVAGEPVHLTRREIQCLKWAAAGKTDQEVAEIIAISLPTVRFHIRNAAGKLGAAGRAQTIHRAAMLGYIGATLPQGGGRVAR